MKPLRTALAWLLVLGLSSSAFAGDLKDSIAKAAQEQAQQPKTSIPKPYLWSGAALFVTGMSMAVYGFLHTSGGEFVSGQVSTESKTKLGATGLAVAGAGGAILFFGSRVNRAPAITMGPGRMTVSKHISW
ncbi:MAG: hypothetical protein ACRD2I_02695 [Vicinamibacterales bacterium]